MKQNVVSISDEIMGGTPVFRGTRVPIETLIDHLKAGDSIDDFLDGFPTVTRNQVVDFLEQAEEQMERLAA
ncbi:MAG: DUF433 domain-containing protein [Pyrinomonadaceae bacterium]